MARRERKTPAGNSGRGRSRGRTPPRRPDSQQNLPAPEASNRDHPAAPGQHQSVPGAGVVGAASAETHTDAGLHPGERRRTPKAAPGAARPDTTYSGASATPTEMGAGGAGSASTRATETATLGSNAPLATPRELAGPSGSAGPASAETADPNFTAASDRAQDRPGHGDTRMDTGRQSIHPPVSTGTWGRAQCNVRDVMTRDLEVASPDTELYYVARMMAERDVGAVPVVESTDSMKPLGIVTDRDIAVRVVAKRQDAADLRARDVMSSDLLTVRAGASLKDCMDQMEQRRVRRALVIDDTGRLIGIVAQADIARQTPADRVGELVREVSQPPGNSA